MNDIDLRYFEDKFESDGDINRCNNFRNLTRQAIKMLGYWSISAEELMVGTAAHESLNWKYNKQVGGPALGFLQMEPTTLKDIYIHYLAYRSDLAGRVFAITGVNFPDIKALQYNPVYSIIMARIHYLRVPEPLPSFTNILGMAKYWDDHYNCNPKKGFPLQWTKDYERYVTPVFGKIFTDVDNMS